MGDLGPTELRLMQGLAQQVTALRPELLNGDATVGELAWFWAKDFDALSRSWRYRHWFVDGELAGWGWAWLPHRIARSDGKIREVKTATWSGRYIRCYPRVSGSGRPRASRWPTRSGAPGRVVSVQFHRSGVRAGAAHLPYRADLHVLIQAPDGALAATAIIWLDKVTRTACWSPALAHRCIRPPGTCTTASASAS